MTGDRSRRISFVLLAPTLLGALWLAAGDRWQEYRRRHHPEIVTAPYAQSAELAGVEWQLRSLDSLAPDAANPTPAGTTRLRLEAELLPRDPGAVERMSSCTVVLGDGRGRRWPVDDRPPWPKPGAKKEPASCGGDHRGNPQAGAWFRFVQYFVVPTAVADEVQPLVELPRVPGRALRLLRR